MHRLSPYCLATLEEHMVFVEGNDEIEDFYISRFLVTQQLWEEVMGDNPAKFRHPQRPVEQVSWHDCQKFVEQLNRHPKITETYRLPKEIEWQYAAYGGKYSHKHEFAGSNEQMEVSVWEINSFNESQSIASKRPNELGIWDMSGNVSEWVEDWLNEKQESKLVSGGAWFYVDPVAIRSSYNYRPLPTSRYKLAGFRLSRNSSSSAPLQRRN